MGDTGAAWPPSSAPRQSITEVLQNPRGGVGLELRESLDFQRLTTQSAPTPPPPPIAAPVNINDFETYLRELAPLYDEAPLSPGLGGARDAASRATSLAAVPKPYFAEDFSVATADDLASLHAADPSAPFDAAQVAALRARLALHSDALEVEMQVRMDERDSNIADALAKVRELRQSVLNTAAEVKHARDRAAGVVDDIARSVVRIDDVVAARRNAVAVLETLRLVKRVRAASDDVRVLLETGQYAAAIDAVHSARSALQSHQLRHVHALAAARARLAKSIEAIDRSLREEFRALTRGADSAVDEAQLLEVADLISRIGRMELLESSYLDEVAAVLEKELSDAPDVEFACRHVRARVGKAARVIRSLHKHREVETDDNVAILNKSRPETLTKSSLPRDDEALQMSMRRLHSIAQEALAVVLDRLLNSFPVARDLTTNSFIVISNEQKVSEVSCFDEAKAAIRFAELMRSLNTLADDLSADLGVESKGGPLRAKCRERVLAFIDAFHKAHVEAVTSTVRMDKWEELPANEGTMRLISSVAGAELEPTSSGENSANVPRGRRIAGPMPTPRAAAPKNMNGTTKRQRVPLVVQGESYYAVLSGYRFARSLCAYALVVDKIPLVSSAAARRGVELSILFNSLVCKAILGAAALEWAGVRTITARHLALASRTVAMAAVLSKCVHGALQGALSQAQSGVIVPLMEKAELEFDDTRKQLLAKVLTIMMQRLAAHEATLRGLPWDKKLEMDRFDIPSSYVMQLAKESSVLHRILWSILPQEEVTGIFQRVCVAYGAHLTDAYGSLDGGKSWVRERVAGDTTYLFSKLSALDVFEVNKKALQPVEKLFQRFSVELSEIGDDEKLGENSDKKATADGTAIVNGVAESTAGGAVMVAESAGREAGNADDVAVSSGQGTGISETVAESTARGTGIADGMAESAVREAEKDDDVAPLTVQGIEIDENIAESTARGTDIVDEAAESDVREAAITADVATSSGHEEGRDESNAEPTARDTDIDNDVAESAGSEAGITADVATSSGHGEGRDESNAEPTARDTDIDNDVAESDGSEAGINADVATSSGHGEGKDESNAEPTARDTDIDNDVAESAGSEAGINADVATSSGHGEGRDENNAEPTARDTDIDNDVAESAGSEAGITADVATSSEHGEGINESNTEPTAWTARAEL